MNLKVIPQDFTVCQVEDYTMVNMDIPYCFPQKTDEENSLVCPTTQVPATTLPSVSYSLFFLYGGPSSTSMNSLPSASSSNVG